ncbi:MAG: hypothetical protein V1779_03515 [bacterium]
MKNIESYNGFLFKDWVNEVAKKFQKPILESTRLADVRHFSANYSEKHVSDFLKGKDYLTASYHSKTPADIWGIRNYKQFYHIILIQVKSSTVNLDVIVDINNSEEDVNKLNKLAKFVKKEFCEQNIFRMPPRAIITTGYTGIFVELNKNINSNKLVVIKSNFINAFYNGFSSENDDLKRIAIKKVKKIHYSIK